MSKLIGRLVIQRGRKRRTRKDKKRERQRYPTRSQSRRIYQQRGSEYLKRRLCSWMRGEISFREKISEFFFDSLRPNLLPLFEI